jgi:CheY-like chemotaxis protein
VTEGQRSRFSHPSEDVRSLIRDDRDSAGKPDLARLVRRGLFTLRVLGPPRPNASAALRSDAKGVGAVPTCPPLKIVLAEDNPHDVTLVRLALSDAGLNFDLSVLADGEQAISFIESLDQDSKQPMIDLLLLDLNLPKRGGEEILKRLRSTERIAQTPVIVMTGSHAERGYETAQKNAAIHYFSKPLNLAEYRRLGTLVRDFFSQKGIRSEILDFPSKEGACS